MISSKILHFFQKFREIIACNKTIFCRMVVIQDTGWNILFLLRPHYAWCYFNFLFVTKKVHTIQCGNFMIFLSLRFSVKSTIGILCRGAKSAILTHLEALNFDLDDFLGFLKAEIYQINKIQSP